MVSDSKNEWRKAALATYHLRLPEKLKTECEEIAKKEGLSLNEWVKRTLATIVGDSNNSIMEQIDNYVSLKYNDAKVYTRADFIDKACKMLLGVVSCPECGALNLYDGTYCTECKEELHWSHPDTFYANKYMLDYLKDHPLPDGWDYSLAVPSKKSDDPHFSILKQFYGTPSYPVLVKQISQDDIDSIKNKINVDSRKLYIKKESVQNVGRPMKKKIEPSNKSEEIDTEIPK